MLVGIDEVGRGCWAGPLVAAAVVLGAPCVGLKDSKKLSKRQRELLALQIEKCALATGFGWVDAATVDRVGLSVAVKMAMRQALSQINIAYDEVIIDGHVNFLVENSKSRAVIKADVSIPEVSAASIVAKVARDKHMSELSEKYAVYGFERHVGYGTMLHQERLRQYGVSDIHRRSFKPVKALLQ